RRDVCHGHHTPHIVWGFNGAGGAQASLVAERHVGFNQKRDEHECACGRERRRHAASPARAIRRRTKNGATLAPALANPTAAGCSTRAASARLNRHFGANSARLARVSACQAATGSPPSSAASAASDASRPPANAKRK